MVKSSLSSAVAKRLPHERADLFSLQDPSMQKAGSGGMLNPALGKQRLEDSCSALPAKPSLISKVLVRELVAENKMDGHKKRPLSLTSGLHLRSWASKEAT